MKAKEGSLWEGWRMDLKGRVYELARAGERQLGVCAEPSGEETN